jgi:hypothetical protein
VLCEQARQPEDHGGHDREGNTFADAPPARLRTQARRGTEDIERDCQTQQKDGHRDPAATLGAVAVRAAAIDVPHAGTFVLHCCAGAHRHDDDHDPHRR